jgi:threonyl-tRNA synthetase
MQRQQTQETQHQQQQQILCHSTSHVLAKAVKDLFPEARLGIGPAITNGFYYDFAVKAPFTDKDLELIENKMREIVGEDLPFEKQVVTKEEALKIFEGLGENYKIELLGEIGDDKVTLFRHGNFIDLCRGPHIGRTGDIKAFKLLSVASSYWRGDEKRDSLQRIYGTAFTGQDELERFLEAVEEAKKRDHRKLGRELDLFSIHEEAGAGLVYWHPKGMTVRSIIEDFWKAEHIKRGYGLVSIPHIARGKLWQVSGHYEFYRENMYFFNTGDGEYVLKPMNCPGHILIYQSRRHSYRKLPIRYAELGTVYRQERTGVLHGMFRVRGFTQDDAHIFCAPEQVFDELVAVLDLATFMLKSFGFTDYEIDLSVRGEDTSKFAGSDAQWQNAEENLLKAIEARNFKYRRVEGEAVFYGPKIDIKLLGALGQGWQGPTIQFDFNLPERFDVNYIGADGRPHPVVMIHRTVLGSMERFVGILIEHYGGAFPVWLAPVQVKILTISEKYTQYAGEVYSGMRNAGFRVELDDRAE